MNSRFVLENPGQVPTPSSTADALKSEAAVIDSPAELLGRRSRRAAGVTRFHTFLLQTFHKIHILCTLGVFDPALHMECFLDLLG